MTDWMAMAQSQPLFYICLTLVAYAAAEAVWQRSGQLTFLNPVLTATCAVAGMLVFLGVPYSEYLLKADIIHEMLALVIILLAVPLCRQARLIRTVGMPVSVALVVGSITAIGTAIALPAALGAGKDLLATLAPKSATTAIAVHISDRLGGIAGLTAVIVISTSIFGAAFGPSILVAGGVHDDRAKGFALGVAANALGTARAFQISETAGAFASLGMILNGMLTIFLLPLIFAAL